MCLRLPRNAWNYTFHRIEVLVDQHFSTLNLILFQSYYLHIYQFHATIGTNTDNHIQG